MKRSRKDVFARRSYLSVKRLELASQLKKDLTKLNQKTRKVARWVKAIKRVEEQLKENYNRS